ncbi:hypothetical protein SS05631_c22610 [Sinorhizobium sp. CCBAU 05631]|nr:hypothetical protein SS05631_c22610 [Sinorhizobium sp. CCBAU 05631]
MPPPQQQTLFSCSLKSSVWGTGRTAHPTVTTDFLIVFLDRSTGLKRRISCVDGPEMKGLTW